LKLRGQDINALISALTSTALSAELGVLTFTLPHNLKPLTQILNLSRAQKQLPRQPLAPPACLNSPA